jgi:hypothetical protein
MLDSPGAGVPMGIGKFVVDVTTAGSAGLIKVFAFQ